MPYKATDRVDMLGRKRPSDKFHIGAHITGKLSLEGSIYSAWDS